MITIAAIIVFDKLVNAQYSLRKNRCGYLIKCLLLLFIIPANGKLNNTKFVLDQAIYPSTTGQPKVRK